MTALEPESESFDHIVASGEAAFAIDRADRVVFWNRACERLLGHRAPEVLGRLCFEVIGGRDLHGNVHCYENCPVIHQARRLPGEPFHRFTLFARTATGERQPLTVSIFLLASPDPALSIIVHVLKESVAANLSRLEALLDTESLKTFEPIKSAPDVNRTVRDLTSREKEVLLCVSRGMSTYDIAESLFISPVTVRNHIKSVLQKLGVHTKFAAVAFAYQNRIV
jgi:PAS domain S-box-containing protein